MDRIASVIGKYKYVPLRKVGSGSFGQAWLVGDKEKDSYVCKMIDISRCSKKEKADALSEASVLRDLKHPNIVRYKESFLEDGWLCIVQEYCEGGDLYQKVQKTKRSGQTFSEDEIIKWFTQGMLALKSIHEKHILHRDLKSSNFFLTKSGDVKMGDFGIAKVLESTAAVAKTQIGTPYYLSPEICQQKAYAWPSDIWAMGCILYELCCLKVPFDAPDLRSLVNRITRGPAPTLPPHFSSQLRQLVAEILARDHTRRPAAATILAKPILAAKVQKLTGSETGTKDSDAPPSDSAEDAGNKGAVREQGAKKEGVSKKGGKYEDYAGKYKKGEIVLYYSETHKEWLQAQILLVDSDGRIQIHCKPNVWLNLQTQSHKIRPRGSPEDPPREEGKEVAKPARSSSYCTPRIASGSPHIPSPRVGGAYHRQPTPPYQGIRSPSPFARIATPRARHTPRNVGTPRGLAAGSPHVKAPFQQNSPRFNANYPPPFNVPPAGAGRGKY